MSTSLTKALQDLPIPVEVVGKIGVSDDFALRTAIAVTAAAVANLTHGYVPAIPYDGSVVYQLDPVRCNPAVPHWTVRNRKSGDCQDFTAWWLARERQERGHWPGFRLVPGPAQPGGGRSRSIHVRPKEFDPAAELYRRGHYNKKRRDRGPECTPGVWPGFTEEAPREVPMAGSVCVCDGPCAGCRPMTEAGFIADLITGLVDGGIAIAKGVDEAVQVDKARKAAAPPKKKKKKKKKKRKTGKLLSPRERRRQRDAERRERRKEKKAAKAKAKAKEKAAKEKKTAPKATEGTSAMEVAAKVSRELRLSALLDGLRDENEEAEGLTTILDLLLGLLEKAEADVESAGSLTDVHPKLLALIEQGRAAGLDVQAGSGHRSVNRQIYLWEQRMKRDPSGPDSWVDVENDLPKWWKWVRDEAKGKHQGRPPLFYPGVSRHQAKPALALDVKAGGSATQQAQTLAKLAQIGGPEVVRPMPQVEPWHFIVKPGHV